MERERVGRIGKENVRLSYVASFLEERCSSLWAEENMIFKKTGREKQKKKGYSTVKTVETHNEITDKLS
jgi:hypothetical protein